ARHIANARGLDHDCTRPTAGEPLVPGKHIRRHQALLRGTPGHHRWNPRTLPEEDGADLNGLEEQRAADLRGGRPVTRLCVVAYSLRRSPHGHDGMPRADQASGNTAVASISTFASASMRADTSTT